jgi:phage shock protein C
MSVDERAEYRPEETNSGNVGTESIDRETMNTENTFTNDSATTGSAGSAQQQTTQTSQSGSYNQAQSQSAPLSATLYRHPTEKMIGGVCGGLADYFKWDAALVRIVWLIATIATGGGGLLAYLVLWGLLPVGTVRTGQQRPAAFALNERNIGRVALVLISLGGLWLLANLGILPGILRIFWWTFGIFFWPALLIGIGYLLLRGTGNTELRVDLNNLKSRFQSRTNGVKMPSSGDIKGSLNQVRERLPLRRSTSDRLFLGVCGGIGKRLGIDANLVRLLWAAFSVGSIGMGVLLYVAMGLLLPEESPASLTPYDQAQDVEVIDGTTSRVV